MSACQISLKLVHLFGLFNTGQTTDTGQTDKHHSKLLLGDCKQRMQLFDSFYNKIIYNILLLQFLGQEYPAIVEFAPFQRIPKHRPNRKKDPKIGSLELDPIFIAFKEKLEAEMLQNKSAANAVKQHFFETSSGLLICLIVPYLYTVELG